MDTGKLITFEGLDGAGKTTQAELLVNWLSSVHKDLPVLYTKEPSEGIIGSDLRLALRKRLALNEKALGALFAADRSDHLDKEILPALNRGHVVVCDRYYVSSFAFQSLFLDFDHIRWLNASMRKPDLILLLNLSPGVALQRLEKSRGTLERYETAEILERVAKAYVELIPRLRGVDEKIVEIDGSQSVENIHRKVIESVSKILRGTTI